MKKLNILKLIFVLILMLFPISCKNTQQLIINEDQPYGMSMLNSFERVFTSVQFDSICIADRLNKNLAKWHQFATRDGETNEVFVEYMYIKQLGQNEIIYRLLKTRDGKYKITKRITK